MGLSQGRKEMVIRNRTMEDWGQTGWEYQGMCRTRNNPNATGIGVNGSGQEVYKMTSAKERQRDMQVDAEAQPANRGTPAAPGSGSPRTSTPARKHTCTSNTSLTGKMEWVWALRRGKNTESGSMLMGTFTNTTGHRDGCHAVACWACGGKIEAREARGGYISANTPRPTRVACKKSMMS
jgi:hypothetical protein